MSWETFAAIALFALPGLGLPPLIYLFLFKPEKYVAWQGTMAQAQFYSTRMSGKKWTDEEIDAIPWSSLSRFWIGAPRSEFVRYAADEPERFPRILNQVRIGGLLLFLFWCVWTLAAFCALFANFKTVQGWFS